MLVLPFFTCKKQVRQKTSLFFLSFFSFFFVLVFFVLQKTNISFYCFLFIVFFVFLLVFFYKKNTKIKNSKNTKKKKTKNTKTKKKKTRKRLKRATAQANCPRVSSVLTFPCISALSIGDRKWSCIFN